MTIEKSKNICTVTNKVSNNQNTIHNSINHAHGITETAHGSEKEVLVENVICLMNINFESRPIQTLMHMIIMH